MDNVTEEITMSKLDKTDLLNIGLEEDFDYNDFEQEAISKIKRGDDLLGREGVLMPLIKKMIEAALEGEMDNHLCEEKAKGSSNRRNGRKSKTISSSGGSISIDSPRDRSSTFEPEIVRKRQTVLNESIDRKVLALFGLGLSYKGISEHLSDIYGLEVSSGKISQITDRLLPVIQEWRNRPLDSVYAVVYLDAIHYKVRIDGKVIPQAIYTILGVKKDGKKEVLGLYLAETEGAKMWLQILTDLRNRGVEDILIACVDGLKGFPEAISSIFPKAEVQLCIIHQIRNSLKYIVSKDQKIFMKDLKLVYQANSKEEAESNLLYLEERWGKKYSLVLKSWNNNWEELSQYFKYPAELRKIIYTTNIVEGLHRQMRKFTKTKGSFTNENSLFKLLYCACMKAEKKWTQPIANWALIASQLDIHFDGRLLSI